MADKHKVVMTCLCYYPDVEDLPSHIGPFNTPGCIYIDERLEFNTRLHAGHGSGSQFGVSSRPLRNGPSEEGDATSRTAEVYPFEESLLVSLCRRRLFDMCPVVSPSGMLSVGSICIEAGTIVS